MALVLLALAVHLAASAVAGSVGRWDGGRAIRGGGGKFPRAVFNESRSVVLGERAVEFAAPNRCVRWADKQAGAMAKADCQKKFANPTAGGRARGKLSRAFRGTAPAPGAVIGALADDTSVWMISHAGVFGEGAEHNARGARDPPEQNAWSEGQRQPQKLFPTGPKVFFGHGRCALLKAGPRCLAGQGWPKSFAEKGYILCQSLTTLRMSRR
jgi:hypothetical protein